jgi:hypothetical protein
MTLSREDADRVQMQLAIAQVQISPSIETQIASLLENG